MHLKFFSNIIKIFMISVLVYLGFAIGISAVEVFGINSPDESEAVESWSPSVSWIGNDGVCEYSYDQNTWYAVDCELGGSDIPEPPVTGQQTLYISTQSGGLTDQVSFVFGIAGCTDNTASNYNPAANIDDSSCNYDPPGCTDPGANNYDPGAVYDNGSCEYPEGGCMDSNAANYSVSAEFDDGSCYYTPGCTDNTASNYNASADHDDGSCIVSPTVNPPVSSNSNTVAVRTGGGSYTSYPNYTVTNSLSESSNNNISDNVKKESNPQDDSDVFEKLLNLNSKPSKDDYPDAAINTDTGADISNGFGGLINSYEFSLTEAGSNNEILNLQRFLNSQGFSVNQGTNTAGSIGRETDFFGRLTKAALYRFQVFVGLVPPDASFGVVTRSLINGFLRTNAPLK